MTPACPKPTKNQSYAEPVQLSRPEYPSQIPTHHADTQISPITLKSSASKTPREKSGFIGWTPELREKNLPLVVDNPRFPHPTLDRHPQPGLAHSLPRPPPTARRLDRALQHRARAHRDVRRDPPLHRCGLQGIRLAPSVSEPPKGAGATTATSCTTSPRRTSGSGRSEKTGDESSIADTNPHHHRTTEPSPRGQVPSKSLQVRVRIRSCRGGRRLLRQASSQDD